MKATFNPYWKTIDTDGVSPPVSIFRTSKRFRFRGVIYEGIQQIEIGESLTAAQTEVNWNV